MGETRRRFTDEFKREAVRLARQPGTTVSSVARDLGVDISVLRRWVARLGYAAQRLGQLEQSELVANDLLFLRHLTSPCTLSGRDDVRSSISFHR